MVDPGSRVKEGHVGDELVWRVGMNTDWLLQEGGNKETGDRGFGVTYQLVSKICPLMISQNH